jgi:hypothetical protein
MGGVISLNFFLEAPVDSETANTRSHTWHARVCPTAVSRNKYPRCSCSGYLLTALFNLLVFN